MSIPMNFYTWWLFIAAGCTSGALMANIGFRGVGVRGDVLTKNQKQTLIVMGVLVAVGFPLFFIVQNAGAIRYEFGGINVLPWLYSSIGAILLSLIAITSGSKDVVMRNETVILVSERKRIAFVGAGFIALALITFIFDLGV